MTSRALSSGTSRLAPQLTDAGRPIILGQRGIPEKLRHWGDSGGVLTATTPTAGRPGMATARSHGGLHVSLCMNTGSSDFKA